MNIKRIEIYFQNTFIKIQQIFIYENFDIIQDHEWLFYIPKAADWSFKQQFYLQNTRKKMSNMSSEDDFNNSGDESQDVNLGRKYIKKSKQNKKKCHKMISTTYKKKRCQFYNKGSCNKGSQCTFSHSFIPDVAKKICKFFITNSCTKGEDCPYSHNTKRYPCKFFHIQQHCGQGNQCRFSHLEIDPEFEEEFLKDNEQFLVKIYRQDRDISQKYITYIQQNDLLNTDKKKQAEPPKSAINLPFIFGIPIIKTASKEENRSQPNNPNKRVPLNRKSSNNQLPFSIRLVHKNRQPIPQRIEAEDNENQEPILEGNGPEAVKSSSSQQNLEFQGQYSEKISQGVEITPESKSQKFYQGLEYYMCSYN